VGKVGLELFDTILEHAVYVRLLSLESGIVSCFRLQNDVIESMHEMDKGDSNLRVILLRFFSVAARIYCFAPSCHDMLTDFLVVLIQVFTYENGNLTRYNTISRLG